MSKWDDMDDEYGEYEPIMVCRNKKSGKFQ